MKMFFISRQGYQEGPHSFELIEDKIKSGYLNPKDYIYDAQKGEWLRLSQFKPTSDLYDQLRKAEEVTEPIKNGIPPNSWYLLKGESQLGPYSYQEMASMLINKKAFEYDYVWSPGMNAWQRVSDVNDFQGEKMETFLKNHQISKPPAFRRKAARVPHGTSLVLHNNKKLWNAEGFEMSSSGASVEIKGQSFNKGEALFIHYRPSKKVPAFNVHCEVISCQNVKKEKGQMIYRLGVRFVKINVLAQKIIKDIVVQKSAS